MASKSATSVSAAGVTATIADVAERAGVSRQTVSNALNAPDRVRPATRERVLAAVTDLGYRPNLHARRLRTAAARTIGIRLDPVSDGVHGVLLDRFLHALTERAAARDVHVLVFTAKDAAAEVRAIGELAARSLADAFILTSTDHDDRRIHDLVAAGHRFVAFGRAWDDGAPAHPWVDVDGRAGTREATNACLERVRRVAFLGWPAGSGAGDERRAGWREAMVTAGLAADLDRSVHDDADLAVEATRSLLEAGAEAIVCASDTLALGAVQALTALGSHDAAAPVPVVGFDDTGVAAGLGFSSVDQNLGAVAEAALALLPGTSGASGSSLIDPRLHRREHPRWGLGPRTASAPAGREEAS